MPRKNTYVFTIERPMTQNAKLRSAKMLTELLLKHNGFTAEVIPRELRPDEEPRSIQCPDDIENVS